MDMKVEVPPSATPYIYEEDTKDVKKKALRKFLDKVLHMVALPQENSSPEEKPRPARGKGWVVATVALATLCLVLLLAGAAAFTLFIDRHPHNRNEIAVTTEAFDDYYTRLRAHTWILQDQKLVRQFSAFDGIGGVTNTFEIHDFKAGFSASLSKGKCYVSAINVTWDTYLMSLTRETSSHSASTSFKMVEKTPMSQDEVKMVAGDTVAEHCGAHPTYMLRTPTAQEEAEMKRLLSSKVEADIGQAFPAEGLLCQGEPCGQNVYGGTSYCLSDCKEMEL